jgi:hypothetical protein
MQCCALCNMRFTVEGGHGKDHRHYCCREHADFAVEKALAVVEPLVCV